jgi:hypothetical protein
VEKVPSDVAEASFAALAQDVPGVRLLLVGGDPQQHALRS